MRRGRQTSLGMIAAAGLALAATVGLPALAADPDKADTPGRFTMHQADGGYLRLDTQTGQMSSCTRKDGRWQCDALADERGELQKDIDKLGQENRDLKSAVKRLEDMIGLGEAPGADKRADKGNQPRIQLPTEKDVDEALNYAQRMLKKFKDKIKELADDGGKGTPL